MGKEKEILGEYKRRPWGEIAGIIRDFRSRFPTGIVCSGPNFDGTGSVAVEATEKEARAAIESNRKPEIEFFGKSDLGPPEAVMCTKPLKSAQPPPIM